MPQNYNACSPGQTPPQQYQNTTGNGRLNYPIAFPYIAATDIVVFTGETGAWTLRNQGTQANEYAVNPQTGLGTDEVVFVGATPGANILIIRRTDLCAAARVFQAGASIRAEDLNTDMTQLRFLVQELYSYLEMFGGQEGGEIIPGEIPDLGDLGDVALNNPITNPGWLRWNGTRWQDRPILEAGDDWQDDNNHVTTAAASDDRYTNTVTNAGNPVLQNGPSSINFQAGGGVTITGSNSDTVTISSVAGAGGLRFAGTVNCSVAPTAANLNGGQGDAWTADTACGGNGQPAIHDDWLTLLANVAAGGTIAVGDIIACSTDDNQGGTAAERANDFSRIPVGGGFGNLQQVTNNGSHTTNSITVGNTAAAPRINLDAGTGSGTYQSFLRCDLFRSQDANNVNTSLLGAFATTNNGAAQEKCIIRGDGVYLGTGITNPDAATPGDVNLRLGTDGNGQFVSGNTRINVNTNGIIATNDSDNTQQVFFRGRLSNGTPRATIFTSGQADFAGDVDIGDGLYENAGNGGVYLGGMGVSAGTIFAYASNVGSTNNNTNSFLRCYSAADAATAKTEKIGFRTDGSAVFTGNIARNTAGGAASCIIGDSFLRVYNTPTSINDFEISLESSGVIQLANAGGGIQFPANASGNANANTLDDYEEGTWQPTVQGAVTAGAAASYTYRNARYSKVGRLVHVEAYVAWTGHTGSGNLQITGLPFSVNRSDTYGGPAVNYWHQIAITAGSSPLGIFAVGGNYIYFYQQSAGLASPINVTATGSIIVGGCYTI